METKTVTKTEEEKPKSVEQLLQEQAEKEREEAIARNKELEEKSKEEERRREEQQAEELRQKKELAQIRMQQVLKKHMKEFEPQPIGEADTRHKMKVENQYDELCNLLNKAITELADFLKLDELPLEKLFDFIKSDPKKWLPKQYIECNEIEIPANFEIEKVIELEMVYIPDTESLSALHSAIQRAWQNIQSERFIYPMKQLYSDETGEFSLPIDFFAAVDEFLVDKTANAEQNVVLNILENLLQNLNDLSDLRILNLEKGPTQMQLIANFFQFKGGDVTINPWIFRRHPALKQFFERPERNQQQTTLNELLQ